MFTVLVVAILAQAPTDAPVKDMKVESGMIVPFDGYCVESNEFVRREKINVRNEVISEEAQKHLLISTPVFVGLVLGAIATGVSITLGSMAIKSAIDKKSASP